MKQTHKKDTFKGEKMLVLHKKAIKKIQKNVFSNGLYVTDIGYFPKAQYHYRKRKNGCTEYILIFCVDGSGWVEVDGKRDYLHNNQYYIIPKSTSHKYGADELNPWSIYWIHFNGSQSWHFVYPLDYPREIGKVKHSLVHDRVKLFEEIYQVLESGHFTNNIEYSSVLLTALLGSLKYLSLYIKTKQIKGEDYMNKVIRYMHDNIDQKLDIETLAMLSKLSVSHFCLLFKEKTLHTPIEHFTFLKMQRACYLLDFSSLKVYEVANSLGYDDTYYFTRVFTKVMGIAPSLYRKKSN